MTVPMILRAVVAAEELAVRHVPILELKSSATECDASGEPYEPTAVDIALDPPGAVVARRR